MFIVGVVRVLTYEGDDAATVSCPVFQVMDGTARVMDGPMIRLVAERAGNQVKLEVQVEVERKRGKTLFLRDQLLLDDGESIVVREGDLAIEALVWVFTDQNEARAQWPAAYAVCAAPVGTTTR